MIIVVEHVSVLVATEPSVLPIEPYRFGLTHQTLKHLFVIDVRIPRVKLSWQTFVVLILCKHDASVRPTKLELLILWAKNKSLLILVVRLHLAYEFGYHILKMLVLEATGKGKGQAYLDRNGLSESVGLAVRY